MRLPEVEVPINRADVNFGDRLFKRLNVKSYNLMCSELFDDREI
ncbi:hypothetical protein QUB75_18300 [Microcoleus sp. K1-B6]